MFTSTVSIFSAFPLKVMVLYHMWQVELCDWPPFLCTETSSTLLANVGNAGEDLCIMQSSYQHIYNWHQCVQLYNIQNYFDLPLSQSQNNNLLIYRTPWSKFPQIDPQTGTVSITTVLVAFTVGVSVDKGLQSLCAGCQGDGARDQLSASNVLATTTRGH